MLQIPELDQLHKGQYLDTPMCPDTNGTNLDETGVDRHIHLQSASSFLSVLTHDRHRDIRVCKEKENNIIFQIRDPQYILYLFLFFFSISFHQITI